MIFVDTSAWFATTVPDDTDHQSAAAWLASNTEPLFTTDYIVDETLTLLKARNQYRRVFLLGDQFFNGELATVYYAQEEDIRTAWEIFRRYADKEWSFTDCLSKVVMERYHIRRAFTFDHHFGQFGSILVEP